MANKEKIYSKDARHQAVDNPNKTTFQKVIENINSAPPEEKITRISAYLKNVNNALEQTFDIGEWYKMMITLRNNLQQQLENYQSFEFKIEGLDNFLTEIKQQLIGRMQGAQEKRGNDWLWNNMPQEASEEYLDLAAYSILLLRRFDLGETNQLSPINVGEQREGQSLKDKLTGFDGFVDKVRKRIIQGDTKYGEEWLKDDLQEESRNELIDTIAYSYFT